MAVGVPFPQSNLVLTAPTAEDALAGNVYDLHVHVWRDLDGAGHVLSKWQFSADELSELQRNGGVLWFHCWGDTHPPIGIEVEDPFAARQT